MNQPKMSIATLNDLPKEAFVKALYGIYEHSPWIPEQAYKERPFSSIAHLRQAMQTAIQTAPQESQLQLIREHPELAGKAAIRKELTEDSNREQSGAGLDTCSPEEYTLLNQLNESYKAKFGFPFILAVKGHNRQSVIKHFAERLDNDYAVEFRTCLMQIDKIAEFRLQNVIE